MRARSRREAGDERAESHVLVQQQFLRLLRVAEGGTEEAARVVERGRPGLRALRRRARPVQRLAARGVAALERARAAAAAEAWERAAQHASRAGDEHERAEILTWIASALWFGPTPVV